MVYSSPNSTAFVIVNPCAFPIPLPADSSNCAAVDILKLFVPALTASTDPVLVALPLLTPLYGNGVALNVAKNGAEPPEEFHSNFLGLQLFVNGSVYPKDDASSASPSTK